MRVPRATRTLVPCRKIRCPKCKSAPFELLELWSFHNISFEYDGETYDKEGSLQVGDPYGVQASCDCGHVWRLRGVYQITCLDTAPGKESGK